MKVLWKVLFGLGVLASLWVIAVAITVLAFDSSLPRPIYVLSEDLDLDGRKEEIYFQGAQVSVVEWREIKDPPLWDISILVKRGGKIERSGMVRAVSDLQPFRRWLWKTPNGKTERVLLIFKAVAPQGYTYWALEEGRFYVLQKEMVER